MTEDKTSTQDAQNMINAEMALDEKDLRRHSDWSQWIFRGLRWKFLKYIRSGYEAFNMKWSLALDGNRPLKKEKVFRKGMGNKKQKKY